MSYKKEIAWFIQEDKHGAGWPLGSTEHPHSKKLSLSITWEKKQMLDSQARGYKNVRRKRFVA